MEIGIIHTPGGGRTVSAITSAADVSIDLTALVGSYVTLETDQPIRYAMVPATGGWSIDPTGALAMASATGLSARGVPGTPYDPTLGGPLPPLLVTAAFPRLLVRAKAGGTSATFVAVVQTSFQVLPPGVAP